jgi:hypothetical protein
MENINGVLDLCIKALRQITDPVKGADVGRLPVTLEEYGDDDYTVILGNVYAERFFSCVTPSLTYPYEVATKKDSRGGWSLEPRKLNPATDAKEGNAVMPAWSADPAITATLFDHLKLYKRPTPATIRKYAGMDTAKFAAALVDIITGKGRGKLDGDSINWRCVYAGYIYLQTDEYLRDQTATFASVPQSKTSNALVKINTNSPDIDRITGRGQIEIQDTVFEIEGYKGNLSTGALILTDIFLYECRRTGSASIAIPLTDLARMKGRSTSKPALDKLRAETVAQMNELSAISYRGRSKVNGRWKDSGRVQLNGGTAVIVNSIVNWNFNQDFFSDVTHLAPMDYPRMLWKVDPRTSQFYFGRYIAQSYRLNEGKPGRQRIKIKTLVEQSPNLPSYARVMQGDRRVKDRIIAKTFKDLDALDAVLFYEVYTADGQLVQYPDSLDYNTFINGYVEIDYSNFPQHPDRLTANKKRADKRKRAAEALEAKKAAEAQAARAEKKQK